MWGCVKRSALALICTLMVVPSQAAASEAFAGSNITAARAALGVASAVSGKQGQGAIVLEHRKARVLRRALPGASTCGG